MSTLQKVQELNRLIQLYDTAIERHDEHLRKAIRGIGGSVQMSRQKYVALVRGDLKLMRKKKAELEEEVKQLEIKAIEDSFDDD